MADISKYEDIINLKHHVSKTRKPMPREDRAAQFAPFAALSGYEDAVDETARITEEKIEQDEGDKEKINATLVKLRYGDEVKLQYFIKDLKKQGGRYEEKEARVKRVDAYSEKLVLSDGEEIPFCDILNIEII